MDDFASDLISLLCVVSSFSHQDGRLILVLSLSTLVETSYFCCGFPVFVALSNDFRVETNDEDEQDRLWMDIYYVSIRLAMLVELIEIIIIINTHFSPESSSLVDFPLSSSFLSLPPKKKLFFVFVDFLLCI
jgi:hypothetical protein